MTNDREKFGAEELANCLSHYDLGIIKNVVDFPRSKLPEVHSGMRERQIPLQAPRPRP